MPPEDTKTLEFNQCQKYDKAPFIIGRSWMLNRKDWWM